MEDSASDREPDAQALPNPSIGEQKTPGLDVQGLIDVMSREDIGRRDLLNAISRGGSEKVQEHNLAQFIGKIRDEELQSILLKIGGQEIQSSVLAAAIDRRIAVIRVPLMKRILGAFSGGTIEVLSRRQPLARTA